ncbi:MAG: hypothetical protein MUE99_11330 [Chitinophagaceae bacterium]|nr:hypothetical protein [Chitinophagaceae bacterium]
MKKYLLQTCLFMGISISLFSQKVSVSGVNEQRSTGDGSYGNSCQIDLKITGDEVRRHKFVKVIKLTKAIDDQDLDLLRDEEDNDFEYKEIEEDARVSLQTKIPSRKATVIKELSGELALYNPTEANGGIVRISNYQAKANTNLFPENAGIKLIYLTPASIEKYKKEQSQKKEEELKKMPEAARELAELLMNAFEGFSGFGDDQNQAMFVMDGDESKLVDLYFEGADGKKIDRNGYTKSGNLIAYYYNEKPDPAWKLVLNIESAGSIKKVPFTLVNIDLP